MGGLLLSSQLLQVKVEELWEEIEQWLRDDQRSQLGARPLHEYTVL